MDVQCERCKTEYEFDDALVSGRGTTVKCTNCGLQFKVRPPGDGTGAERWLVHTTRGQALVFTSLRDLQRAITTHEVGRGDTLRRGNAPPRMLGTIAELEPFFLARPRRRSDGLQTGEDAESRMPTLRPPPFMAVPPSTAPARLAPVSAGGVDRAAPTYSDAATVLTPHVAQPAAPAVVSRQPSALSAPNQGGRPLQTTVAYQAPPDPPRRPVSAPVAVAAPVAAPLAVAVPVNVVDVRSDPLETSEPLPDLDSAYSPILPRRRMGGWVVAAVLLVCVGVIGYRVATPYLAATSKGASHKVLDPRAQQFLKEGESAFEAANLELAKEKFDKASALDESNPRVLLDVARLAVARADIAWLDTRILPESPDDDLRAAKQRLTDLGAVAKRAADAAATAASDDMAATRVRVDALRIVGDRDAARASVAKIIGTASQPETSYVLAALDLAEIDPLWGSVIDRLRVAAAGEGNVGRARAALVYALARSGNGAGAKAELDRLAALPAHYPLVADLRAFLTRVPSAKSVEVPVVASASARPVASTAVVDVDSLPHHATATGGGGGGGGGGAPDESTGGGGGDVREILRQAAAAESRGQYPRAMQLYENAIHLDSSSSEALAGLGSVALKTGDYGSARSYFGRAISLNPNYVPAHVGQADAMWAQGDRAGAITHYKENHRPFPRVGRLSVVREDARRGEHVRWRALRQHRLHAAGGDDREGRPDRCHGRDTGCPDDIPSAPCVAAGYRGRSARDAAVTGMRAGALLPVVLLVAACDGRPRIEPAAETRRHSGPALVVLNLSTGVPEVASGSLLSMGKRQGTFDQLVGRIGEIADDRDAKGVFVRFGDATMGFARAEEIGGALEAVRQNGKPVYCHGDAFDNATLYAAARACDKIYLAPAGAVEAIGLAAEVVYLHKLLAEQLHVSVDILQVGKFKGTGEGLTRDGPSEEARASLTGTLGGMRDSWISGIRVARGDVASAAVEDGPYSPLRAKALQLVDEVGYADDARDEARKATGAVRDEVRFGRSATASADGDVGDIVRVLVGEATSAPVALVRASGAISMGTDDPVFARSGGISARSLGRVLARLEADDTVRAVVLRIDSPGGSALGSDLLWHRLMRIRAKKTLVVSVGEMAASGGYYLASAGQVIFAERGSIIGSVGVVGGKLAFGRALSQVGVHAETFPANPQATAGARAAYPSMLAEWDDATRARVLEEMTAVYDLFLSRVAEGRHTTVDAIAPFAEGRIFSGAQGRDHGLVDEIGGLSAAIAKARVLAKLPKDAELEPVGVPRGVWNALAGVSADGVPSVQAAALAALASPGDVLVQALGRLAPAVAPFAQGLAPLAQGERALTVVPFAFVVR